MANNKKSTLNDMLCSNNACPFLDNLITECVLYLTPVYGEGGEITDFSINYANRLAIEFLGIETLPMMLSVVCPINWSNGLFREYKEAQLYSTSGCKTINNTDEQGNSRLYLVSYFPYAEGVAVTFVEISKIQHTIFKDELTNAYNRKYLSYIKEEFYKSIILVDVDDFKSVNDNYGHLAGDQFLTELVDRLNMTVPSQSVIIRTGGDEFLVLCTLKDVEEVVGDINTAIHNSVFQIEKAIITGKVSIGYARIKGSLEEAMRNADLAMYEAKRTSSRIAKYTPKLKKEFLSQLATKNELEDALKVEDQLILHYQPIMELATETIIGFETLIRWKHPSKGLIYPNDFLPIAEKYGILPELTDYVLRRAVAQLNIWREKAKKPFKLAVNISAYDLLFPYFQQRLDASVAGYDELYLELTETSLQNIDIIKLKEVIEACVDKGYSFSLDDFGTGWSTLSILQYYYLFRSIKIDRSFVSSTKENIIICKLIKSLADQLGLDTIAEGIESAEHLEILKNIGIKYGQGWHFYKDLPPSEIDKLSIFN